MSANIYDQNIGDFVAIPTRQNGTFHGKLEKIENQFLYLKPFIWHNHASKRNEEIDGKYLHLAMLDIVTVASIPREFYDGVLHMEDKPEPAKPEKSGPDAP